MTEYKINNATVRIHGEIERENVERATIKYLKGVLKCRKSRNTKEETES